MALSFAGQPNGGGGGSGGGCELSCEHGVLVCLCPACNKFEPVSTHCKQ